MAMSAGSKNTEMVNASWRRFVEYPTPHRDGFRDIATPGHEDGGDAHSGRATEEEFCLRVESLNSTGWGPLKRRLLSTEAQVVLAQETWLLQDKAAEAADWARRHGWEAILAPAALGPGGGASGGVGIFAKTGVGLRYPIAGSHILEEARAVAGFIDPPGHRPILAASVYL